MNAPGDYARRVRARPYGPLDVTAGTITAWFHGPFAVLTVAGSGASLTLRAAADEDPPSGRDLAALLDTAACGGAAVMARPEGLVTAGGGAPPHRLTVAPAPGGTLLHVQTADGAVSALVGAAETACLADHVRRWLNATA
jgi:hypothetical protein